MEDGSGHRRRVEQIPYFLPSNSVIEEAIIRSTYIDLVLDAFHNPVCPRSGSLAVYLRSEYEHRWRDDCLQTG